MDSGQEIRGALAGRRKVGDQRAPAAVHEVAEDIQAGGLEQLVSGLVDGCLEDPSVGKWNIGSRLVRSELSSRILAVSGRGQAHPEQERHGPDLEATSLPFQRDLALNGSTSDPPRGLGFVPRGRRVVTKNGDRLARAGACGAPRPGK